MLSSNSLACHLLRWHVCWSKCGRRAESLPVPNIC